MKNLVFLVLASIFSILLLCSAAKEENNDPDTGGSPTAGFTGSPSEVNCGDCHAEPGATVTIGRADNVPFTSYVPGRTYNMKVTVAKSGQYRFGIALEALRTSDATSVGTLVAGSGSHLQIESQTGQARVNLVHDHVTALTTDQKVFDFQWTAPTGPAVSVKFYASGAAATIDILDSPEYFGVGTLSLTTTVDCNNVPGGSALPGTSCSDGLPCTAGEVWDNFCVCSGGTGVPGPTMGSTGSNGPICVGGTLNLNAMATGGTVSYSWVGPNGFSSTAQNPSIPNATLAAAGLYTVTASNGCGTNATAQVNVTINAPPNAGVDGALLLCSNGAPVNLFSSLSGSPQAGGSWSFGGNPHAATYTPATDAPGVYTYTVTGAAPCANATATVIVTENAPANAGTNGTLAVCSNGASVNLIGSLLGSPQGGGSWTFGGNPHAGAYNPVTDAPGIYTYTVAGAAPCANATATVTVTETSPPNAGTSSSITLCSNGSPLSLFSALVGTPQPGGTWSPAGLTGGSVGTFTPGVNTATAYTYTVTGTPPCTSASATVSVTVSSAPNAGSNGVLSICNTGAAVDLLDQLNGTPQSGGSWSGPSTVLGNTYDPATMTAGLYTYTIAGPFPCANASAQVLVTESTNAVWYEDQDSDGAGDPNSSIQSCDPQVGYVSNNTDDCPLDGTKQAEGQCGCGTPDTDSDADGTANCNDDCPNDPTKIALGECGCGVPDTDGDGDGTANCVDGCPNDPGKTALGQCGCGVPDTDDDGDGTANCNDGCPLDPEKIASGPCGCGNLDTDTDMDGIADCNDSCINEEGQIGSSCDDDDIHTVNDVLNTSCVCVGSAVDCNDDFICTLDSYNGTECVFTPLPDSDNDGFCDLIDGCPNDPLKTGPGVCGCGTPDTDTDSDGTLDCDDDCPMDPDKIEPLLCGCDVPETDTDDDGTPDCNDDCPEDPEKTVLGQCGCGNPDTDTDLDGVADCIDTCIEEIGQIGSSCDDGDVNTIGEVLNENCDCVGSLVDCDDTDPCTIDSFNGTECIHLLGPDADNDGACDLIDECPDDPFKQELGQCGCAIPDTDSDGDGTANCNDDCPNDPNKIALGQCGCGIPDTDTDGDGTANCNDGCPGDPFKIDPLVCGCDVPDTDTDDDGTPDCIDGCPLDPDKIALGQCGCGNPDTDTDLDGIADCIDTCIDVEGQIGSSCDDFDVTTTGDVLNEDCECAGSLVDCDDFDPCTLDSYDGTACINAPLLDSDEDGLCDLYDGCPNDPDKTEPGHCGCGAPEPGTDCDDDQPNTGLDQINESCGCSGLLLDCELVPGGPGLVGTPCDDHDDCTVGDTWDLECNCASTPVEATVEINGVSTVSGWWFATYTATPLLGATYEWTVPDGWTVASSTFNQAVIGTDNTPGVYPLCVTASLNGCELTDCIDVEINVSNGIDEVRPPMIDWFMLFPNPSNGTFQLVPHQELPPTSIVLYDATGRVVRAPETIRGKVAIPVDLGEVGPGMYYLLATMKGERRVMKFLVER